MRNNKTQQSSECLLLKEIEKYAHIDTINYVHNEVHHNTIEQGNMNVGCTCEKMANEIALLREQVNMLYKIVTEFINK